MPIILKPNTGNISFHECVLTMLVSFLREFAITIFYKAKFLEKLLIL